MRQVGQKIALLVCWRPPEGRRAGSFSTRGYPTLDLPAFALFDGELNKFSVERVKYNLTVDG